MTWEMIELKEGEPVVFLAVHALRWRQEWGEPAAGFVQSEVDIDALQAENERLREEMAAHMGTSYLIGDLLAAVEEYATELDKYVDELADVDARADRLQAENERLRSLLSFALMNEDKFTEFDTDGVKARWIIKVEDAMKGG